MKPKRMGWFQLSTSLFSDSRWVISYLASSLLLFVAASLDRSVATEHGVVLIWQPSPLLQLIYCFLLIMISSLITAAIIMVVSRIRSFASCVALSMIASIFQYGVNGALSGALQLLNLAPLFWHHGALLMAPSLGDLMGPYKGGLFLPYVITLPSIAAFLIFWSGLRARGATKFSAFVAAALADFGGSLLTWH